LVIASVGKQESLHPAHCFLQSAGS